MVKPGAIEAFEVPGAGVHGAWLIIPGVVKTHKITLEVTEKALFAQVIAAVDVRAKHWTRIIVGEDNDYLTAVFYVKKMEHKLSVNKLLVGLGILAVQYPRHFANVICGDVSSSDALVQCALLGNIVYPVEGAL